MLTTGPQVDSEVRTLPSLKPRPRPARYGAAWSVIMLGADLIGAAGAVACAQTITHESIRDLAGVPGALEAVAFGVLFWILLFERIGMYRRSFSSQAHDDVYASLAASALSMIPALAIFLCDPLLWPFRHTLVLALFLSVIGVSLTRYIAQVARLRFHTRRPRRIAVVGAPERVKVVPGDLSLSATDQVVRIPIEAFDDDIQAALEGEIAEISWLRVVRDRECNELIVTEALPSAMMPEFLRYTESHGIKVAFAPMRIRPHACDFSIRRDGGLALLYPRSLTICTPAAEGLRRVFDLLLTLPAVVLLAPLLGVIALTVYLDSGAPVLYRQTRVGRRNQNFEILKFRTMKVDAESDSGPVWARSGESRTTRVGRFLRRTSLDELPQLFNVLRGEMSLVGPRPERPFYVEQFRKMLPRYDERHLVRPGITGWSHIHMKRNVDTSAIGERLSYDLFYLEHWSIFMDILIVCKTAAEFLFHSAA